MSAQSAENGLPSGDAYGADATYHHLAGGAFWCSAPDDAKCRTSPTCECENWCCCDGSPEDAVDNHDEGEHCCMSTAKAGQSCWIAVWVDAQGVEDSMPNTRYADDGEPIIPDGPVACDWADGIYLTSVIPPAKTGADS